MSQTTRYISRQLIMSSLLITFVMTGVIWLFVGVRAVESIVNQGLSVKLFLLITSLQLPNFLTHILPISLFIAVLFVYTRLNSDREIVVMRAAGQSPMALAKPVIFLSLFVMLLVYTLTLWATPTSYKTFRNLQWDIRYSLAHIVLKEGVFNIFSDSITVYLRERSSRNELKGLLVHDSRDKDRPVTYHAESGTLVEAVNGAKVILLRGNSIFIDKKNPQLGRVVFFDRHTLDLTNLVNKPTIRFREARERGVAELLTLKKSDVGNPNDFGKFVVEGHQRLAMPLTVLSFALIGLVTLLRGDLSRRGQLKRILAAVGIFIVLMSINLGLINLSVKNLSLVPVIYIANALPIVLALMLLTFPGRIGSKANRLKTAVVSTRP
ncbi:MAG: LPS export ABC transporter permease LptF [Rhodospirillaceae bacterium TMED167]|nr:LPS export ABC transporter permease LptF [Rhodospirillaceae bacterium]OUW27551.1 MAG: LPS export ABC transporter permease LptF [Rhodospirillaceae bacterium TMED167]